MDAGRWTRAWCLAAALVLWTQARAETVVSLTFDDGRADQLQVRDLLAPVGMKATFFIISSRVGRPGSLTLQDLRALEAEGHEVGGHTLHHEELANLTEQEVHREVCVDRTRLLSWGLSPTSFAYPFGADSEVAHRMVAACGYTSARDVRGLRDTCAACPPAETLPPLDPFDVRTPDTVKREHTLQDIQGWVMAAEAAGEGWVPLVFHAVSEDCSDLEYCVQPSTLRELVAWLAARRMLGTHVRTVREVVGETLRPAAHAMSLPATPLLKNPSLELDGDGDGMPDCWQLGGAGGPALRAEPDLEAHEGARSFLLSHEGTPGGTRQLTVLRDDGTCAPLLPPDEGRRVSAWYRASTPVHLLVSFRVADGTWGPWKRSGAWPASEAWTQASWLLPRAPPGAVGLSVGVAMDGPGWVRVDAFALEQAVAPEPSALTVRVPNGGERLVAGSEVEVEWASAGSVPEVDVSFSTDGGATWRPLATQRENTGRLSWRVPGLPGTQALVRVASAGEEGVEDVSDAPFRIVPPEGAPSDLPPAGPVEPPSDEAPVARAQSGCDAAGSAGPLRGAAWLAALAGLGLRLSRRGRRGLKLPRSSAPDTASGAVCTPEGAWPVHARTRLDRGPGRRRAGTSPRLHTWRGAPGPSGRAHGHLRQRGTGTPMRTLAESPHFILAHEHESAFAVDKRSGARHPVGEHYGDPCCGLISPDQDWFLVGGEGLTFLDLQRGPRKFLRPAGRGALFIHALRLEGRRRVRVLVDPWAEEHASTWELDLDRLSVSKLADGPRLVNQPYREDVPF